MTVLVFFAFISGLITILAPCIWPILPIILISSNGKKAKSLGITLGICLSFLLFTLLLSYILRIFPLDPDIFRKIAVVILIILGLTLIIPKLNQLIEGAVSRLTSKFNPKIDVNKDDYSVKLNFFHGFISGLAIGSVWSPCAGPILASIAALTATQRVNLDVAIIILFYILGVAIPLFVFSLFGGQLVDKLVKVNRFTGVIQRVFGALLVIMAVTIFTNADKKIAADLLSYFPGYSNFLYKIEGSNTITKQLDSIKSNGNLNDKNLNEFVPDNINMADKYKKLKNYGPAPDIIGITNWINSEELSLKDLKGKVVLIDFWTYTCINCIRTLPYVTKWYDTYSGNGTSVKDKDFIVIGVHTPEFEFEKKTENVEAAIKQYNIHYPVAQDNNYSTWENYSNRYWPAHYLIDANGDIRHVHFGEGAYKETEEAIIELLKEAGRTSISESNPKVDEESVSNVRITPETYLGLSRMDRFSSNEKAVKGLNMFTLKDKIPLNNFGYAGPWFLEDESAYVAKSAASASIKLHFMAKKVFLVIHPSEVSSDTENPNTIKQVSEATVLLDGKIIANEQAGKDVKNGIISIDQPRLYELVDLKTKSEDHELIINFSTQGISVYAFTFGS